MSKSFIASPLTPDGYVGYLVRHTRTSGFKFALIVGSAEPRCYADGSDRIRVRFWRAASSRWTQPTLVERRYLQAITSDEVVSRRRVITVASAAAVKQNIVEMTWT